MALDRTRSSLELLLNISRELATTLDLDTVLERVLALSIQNVDAERGSMIVLDKNKTPTHAALNFEGQSRPFTMETIREIVSNGLAGWVVDHRKPALIKDTEKDDRWLTREGELPEVSKPKSAICVPVTVADDLVGVMTMVHPKAGFFNEENLALLQAIADLAGVAIHNATLYESLNAAQQRYRALFDESINPILITDVAGKILEANRPAGITSGYQIKDLLTMNIQDLHEVHHDQFIANVNFLEKGKPITYQSVLLRADKPQLPIEVFMQKVKFGGTPSIQWLIRDISERKELDSLREDLAAMIYHDLRAPLGNIISSLEILDTMLPPETSSTLRSVFQITNRSAERMQRLINSLLDINRLESGQAIANKKTIDITELAQEAVETVMSSIEGKQQQLEMNFAKDLPGLLVDVDMIRRVMINLLENASKFTPTGGRITIGATHDGKLVQISVSDDGLGIPQEMKEFIFEKFTRLKVEGTPKGVGLGLAFCRMAVEAHGGRIWVEPNQGKGSRFIFTLPAK